MRQSYVRRDMNVVYTSMTCGTPREIRRVDKGGNIINAVSKLPLLNTDDKKISGTFVCKMLIEKWGGLLTFLAGVTVGALIVAAIAAADGVGVVLLPVIVVEGWMVGAAIAAGTTVATYAGYKGVKEIAHDCDNTLELFWNSTHPSILIEHRKTLLNGPYMMYTAGGLISIIANPE